MPRRRPDPQIPPKPAAASPEEKAKGGFRFTQLGAIVAERPVEAGVLLASHLRANDGNVSKTARSLGTTYRTVSRWIKQLKESGNDPTIAAS